MNTLKWPKRHKPFAKRRKCFPEENIKYIRQKKWFLDFYFDFGELNWKNWIQSNNIYGYIIDDDRWYTYTLFVKCFFFFHIINLFVCWLFSSSSSYSLFIKFELCFFLLLSIRIEWWWCLMMMIWVNGFVLLWFVLIRWWLPLHKEKLHDVCVFVYSCIL